MGCCLATKAYSKGVPGCLIVSKVCMKSDSGLGTKGFMGCCLATPLQSTLVMYLICIVQFDDYLH